MLEVEPLSPLDELAPYSVQKIAAPAAVWG
jgi:hypothetical protein